MRAPSAKSTNRRIRLLLLVFALAFAGTLARAVWIQGVQAQPLERLAASQHQTTIGQPARRGTLYDRVGVPLALGTETISVYADPKHIRDAEGVATVVGNALALDPAAVLEKLADRRKRFVYLARQVDRGLVAGLQKSKIDGLGFIPEERRDYPHGDVAAQVLGYAGVDNRGLAGLELSLDRVLAGRPGEETVIRDPTGRAIDVVNSVEVREGRDVHLTIDHLVQAHTESILRDTRRYWRAKAATAIVLDVRSGGLLALATVPGFNANEFPNADRERLRNRAVTDVYEPGSTFKVVTVAGVLSERLVSPDTEYWLAPTIQVADREIHEDRERSHEQMTVSQILGRSSNVGAVTLAQVLGSRRLSRWVGRFGFGRRTGIEFPGETRGIVPKLGTIQWSGATIGNLPIGQGIAVTPVQMAAAYGAIANNGVWVQPHLVHRVGGEPSLAPKRRRIMPKWVAKQLRLMLRGVVEEELGSGHEAAVAGYRVAGKTGTAAKPDEHGYSTEKYVASFVGVVPATRPRLVVLIAVDEPERSIYGGAVAAPAFADIARFALQYLGVEPDAPVASEE